MNSTPVVETQRKTCVATGVATRPNPQTIGTGRERPRSDLNSAKRSPAVPSGPFAET